MSDTDCSLDPHHRLGWRHREVTTGGEVGGWMEERQEFALQPPLSSGLCWSWGNGAEHSQESLVLVLVLGCANPQRRALSSNMWRPGTLQRQLQDERKEGIEGGRREEVIRLSQAERSQYCPLHRSVVKRWIRGKASSARTDSCCSNHIIQQEPGRRGVGHFGQVKCAVFDGGLLLWEEPHRAGEWGGEGQLCLALLTSTWVSALEKVYGVGGSTVVPLYIQWVEPRLFPTLLVDVMVPPQPVYPSPPTPDLHPPQKQRASCLSSCSCVWPGPRQTDGRTAT
ncbi:unnamed protein product [Pleuronectes platessa]|uniref:Uncharacterized protein n=1 Tax=Pleuronectes platessa TaxID=8262 RepID=A0A9N7YE46_PLEPL|nr:unnamed protein product [Pleuronectes platessa]